ncbi:GumC family protein [Beijerinckia mobilis]|uniref:GumC family protein n=1 Tax=Beijerinckia mobilis TaxID=231434 RepID=UPI0012EC4582|nr:hypothetical protein [Beijerinckia mobilis]
MTNASEPKIASKPRQVKQLLRIALSGVFRDKRRILCVMASVIVLTCLSAVMVTPKFVANSTLLVLLSQDYTSQPAVGTVNVSPVMLEKDAILKGEVEILVSPAIAKAVLRTIGFERVYPDLVKEAWTVRLSDTFSKIAEMVGWKISPRRSIDPLEKSAIAFSKDLFVTPDKIGNVISLGFRHRDPEIAAEVLNELTKAYFVKRAAIFANVQSPYGADRAAELRQQLDHIDHAYADYKARNGISDYSLQRDLLLRQQGDISRDMQQADNDIAQMTQRSSVIRRELDQTPQDTVVYGGVQSQIRHGRPTVVATLETDYERVKQDLEAAKARRAIDTNQLAQVEGKIKQLDEKSVELTHLERQRELTEQNYASVIKELNAHKFQEEVNARKAANVRVIQPADVPTDRGNIRLIIVMFGILVSLFAGVVTAILSEFFRYGFICSEKLEYTLGTPVLVSVPMIADLEPAVASPSRGTIAELQAAKQTL